MSALANCNQCEKDFEIVDQLRLHADEIEEHYFVCPHCNVEYTFLVTDEELRKEQEEIKKLHDEYFRRRNAAQVRMEILKSDLEVDKIINHAMDVTENLD